MRIIASNGSFVGPVGYPRHYIPRSGLNGVTPDAGSVYNVAQMGDKANLCRYPLGDQTGGFPPISAAAGDQLAIRYLENGHVTLDGPDGGPRTPKAPPRPADGGIVFVYGTKQPKANEKFADVHRKWNADGTGGDKRGRLLATRPYDDGECYQENPFEPSQQRQKEFPKTSGTDLICQSDVQLPLDAGSDGQYTFYWVWEWPLPNPTTGAVVTPETYTSCMEVNVVANSIAAFKVGSFVDKQMGNTHAIKAQLENQFLIDPSAVPNLQPAPSAKNPNPQPIDGPVSQQPSQPASSVQPSQTQSVQPRPTFPPFSGSPIISSEPSRNTMTAPPGAPSGGNDRFVTVTVTARPSAELGGDNGNAKETVTVTATEYLVIAPGTTIPVVPTLPASKPASSALSQQPTQDASRVPTPTGPADIKPSGPPKDLRPFDPSASAGSSSTAPVPTATTAPSKDGPTVYSRSRLGSRFRKARRDYTAQLA